MDSATTEIYTPPLHAARPIYGERDQRPQLPGSLRQVSFRRAYFHSQRVECFKPRRRSVLPVRRRSHVGSGSQRPKDRLSVSRHLLPACLVSYLVMAIRAAHDGGLAAAVRLDAGIQALSAT